MAGDVPVTLRGLLPTPQGVGVFLGNDQKVMAIFVDHLVAAAMTMAIKDLSPPRPLTHDLLVNVLAGFGVRVRKVVINDLKDETFFARLHLVQENELGRNLVEIDARPSDSIVLALRHRCPIVVARSVWDAAEDMTWALDQAKERAEEDRRKDEESGDPPEDGIDRGGEESE